MPYYFIVAMCKYKPAKHIVFLCGPKNLPHCQFPHQLQFTNFLKSWRQGRVYWIATGIHLELLWMTLENEGTSRWCVHHHCPCHQTFVWQMCQKPFYFAGIRLVLLSNSIYAWQASCSPVVPVLRCVIAWSRDAFWYCVSVIVTVFFYINDWPIIRKPEAEIGNCFQLHVAPMDVKDVTMQYVTVYAECNIQSNYLRW